MLKVLSKTLVLLFILCSWFPEAFGQPVLPYDLKKPKKFENKKLGAEKSSEKKFKGPRRFIQNTVTHYNWYFNANNKLNEIVERAKLANKDDYTILLPFYNYSLEKTAGDKTELDSVIYKSNAGILTHDLRNAWIDNLYMLMGEAYYFRNDLDSAYMTFQYINYAFSPKDDGYDLPIGSNSNEGGSAFSISTKENNTLIRRAMSTAPSRNESFIWQIKTYIEKGAMPEAASLIQTIKNDPVFPGRLQDDLNEVQAHWFYKQKVYDSAAIYLEKALGNAADKAETSRWEYLIAQLYELAKQPERAQEFYERAIRHTLDPVLEVYSRLNAIRQNTSDSISIKKNIEELRKMGRRDKYAKYRDIVYYTAAQIELQRNNIAGAKEMLLRSTAASTENLNPAQRTRSFLLLGDLSFQEKNYGDAKRFYDSVNNNDPGIVDVPAFEKTKATLSKIVLRTDIMHRQDSLQQIAAMKPAEREAMLKKMARQLRRKQGLKDEETIAGNAAVGLNQANEPATDLFNDNTTKGDWYFANASLKSKGLSSFKQTWGSRPNVDNWRRMADIKDAAAAKESKTAPDADKNLAAGESSGTITYETLLKNIPITPEQMEKSQDSVENAMVDLGIIYIDGLEEYPAAIDTLERFTDVFPYSSRKPEALYYLYYAYRKLGNEAKAQAVQHELDQKYAGTRFQKQVNNAVTGSADKEKKSITRAYENVYNLFIEGNFAEALNQKKINDSLYGSSYWTPQLLYIEAVYFLHSRQDDQAKKVLNNIIDLYPENPMSTKAKNILEVLGRRKEIEDYLTKLEIKRIEDSVVVENPTALAKPTVGTPMKQDSLRLIPVKMSLADSLAKMKKPVVTAPDLVIKKDTVKTVPSAYSFNVEAPHAVAIVMVKVDPVYVSESRNAFNRYNLEKYYNTKIDIANQPLNDTVKLVVMSGFDNAALAREYMEKTQAVAATQIVPWLPAGKYTFILISMQNIEVLKNRQDLNEYRKFQEKYFPKK
jgi:tetratricopeptide (TPR) repeat protein